MPELRNVVADEVSVVDKPAIRKRILLFKSEKGGPNMLKLSDKASGLLSERLNKADERESEVLTKVEEIRKAAGQPFGEEERDVALALLRVAGATDTPAEKRAEQVAAMMGAPEKVVKNDPPTTESTVAEIVKAEVAKAVVDLQKANEEKDKQIAALVAKASRETAIKKAAGTKALGSKDKLAEVIEKAEAAGFGDELLSILSANGEAIEKSKLFIEIGSSLAAEGSAIQKMESAARERIAKSATPMTFEQALVKIAEEQPELYASYQAERAVN